MILYFDAVVELEVDSDQLERNIHLFSDFDRLLESQVESVNRFGVLRVVLIELSLG
jgi:hypothetical protein